MLFLLERELEYDWFFVPLRLDLARRKKQWDYSVEARYLHLEACASLLAAISISED